MPLDPATPQSAAPVILAIFGLTYLGIGLGRVPGLKLDRTGIVLLGAIAMMVFGDLPTADVIGFIDWPTILLLFGFFVLSAQLRLSGFFDAVAEGIARRLDRPVRFLILLMLATAGLSAFLNHDIVCLVFAPIVATALLRRGLDPVPFLVALAISSNIGAAATLVGNPQDMLIGQVAGLAFGAYALWALVPVLFALSGAFGVIWFLSRHQMHEPAVAIADPAVMPTPLDRAHTVKGLVILTIVIGCFFTPLPRELVALAAAGIHLASPKFRTIHRRCAGDWCARVAKSARTPVSSQTTACSIWVPASTSRSYASRPAAAGVRGLAGGSFYGKCYQYFSKWTFPGLPGSSSLKPRRARVSAMPPSC